MRMNNISLFISSFKMLHRNTSWYLRFFVSVIFPKIKSLLIFYVHLQAAVLNSIWRLYIEKYSTELIGWSIFTFRLLYQLDAQHALEVCARWEQSRWDLIETLWRELSLSAVIAHEFRGPQFLEDHGQVLRLGYGVPWGWGSRKGVGSLFGSSAKKAERAAHARSPRSAPVGAFGCRMWEHPVLGFRSGGKAAQCGAHYAVS